MSERAARRMERRRLASEAAVRLGVFPIRISRRSWTFGERPVGECAWTLRCDNMGLSPDAGRV